MGGTKRYGVNAVRTLPAVWIACAAEVGCGAEAPRVWPDDYAEVMDPKTCESCHPKHYKQWLGSMHAYAADDPVFLAMNRRGQRETNGELGDFCIKCHAPMAVRLGATADGLNVAELPRFMKGVTCYFCHNVASVEGTHNNPLRLREDGTMLGSIADPYPNPVHDSAYSRLLDDNAFESSDMCGACHDIVTPQGVHLERTFAEWKNSFYAAPSPDDPHQPAFYGLMCSSCHMQRELNLGPIAEFEGVPGGRGIHDHRFAGVDTVMTAFPDAELGPELLEEQLEARRAQRSYALFATLCVQEMMDGGGHVVTAWLHNESAGHAWPSGAAQDRRTWVEVVASSDGRPVFETGVVAPGEALLSVVDPVLWSFRDTMLDAAGDEVHMFWDAVSVQSNLLPVGADVTADASTWVSRSYRVESTDVDHVTMRMRVRAVGLDVLDHLIASQDLDPMHRRAIRTDDIEPTKLVWTPDSAVASPLGGSCVHSSKSSFAPGTKG
ncbi:MAG: multiheme c-type cytochrome [Nannocystaceae bacterium]